MKGCLNCKKVGTAIKRAKEMLVKKAEKSGMCENFGQKEVREIKDQFVDISDFSSEMNSVRQQVDAFDDWCANYTRKIK